MKIEDTGIDGLLLLTPVRRGDHRGFFSESWNLETFRKADLHFDFVQDNHSFSSTKGTLRGLHYQGPPRAQDKLVRCGRGALFDVAVDARVGSATYGRSFGAELSFENGRQLLVPKGFLHGFVTLVDETEIIYKCSDTYAPETEGGVVWNSVDIDWPLTTEPVLSDKDRDAPTFADWVSPFTQDTV